MANNKESKNQDGQEPEISVEDFFSDPKNTVQATFLRKAFRHVFAELATEEEAARAAEKVEADKNKKPAGILDVIFGVKK